MSFQAYKDATRSERQRDIRLLIEAFTGPSPPHKINLSKMCLPSQYGEDMDVNHCDPDSC